ncbi:MAG: hypothetical protein L0H20_03355 [Corynebacterium sp.]|uniref:LGFP repeat-containing protein n=1 Tax=Corynebacterium sp. TaxID=1720 RepID=UPI0026497948|nr:hypothetical protein [Corynebacterium sp.]MDN5722029.1 hypothetical protein [Corynebacterium sp.]
MVAPVASAQYMVGGRIGLELQEAAAANDQSPVEFFGPPLTPELDAARGGRWQNFSNDQAIYWHPLVSDGYANQIGGEIRAKWGETTGPDGGWEWGPLRYPTTREWPSAESAASGKVARGNHFEGGSIYEVPDSGTYVVWGLIRTAWWTLGAEGSDLGLPTSDERTTDNGWIQDFEGGSIQAFHSGMVAVATHDPAATTLDTGGPVTLQELR